MLGRACKIDSWFASYQLGILTMLCMCHLKLFVSLSLKSFIRGEDNLSIIIIIIIIVIIIIIIDSTAKFRDYCRSEAKQAVLCFLRNEKTLFQDCNPPSYCAFLGLVLNHLVLKLSQHILRTENANMLNGKTVCDA